MNMRRQHRLEQTALLVIRQERFGTIWSTVWIWRGGWELEQKGRRRGGGTTQGQGIELRGRSYAAPVSSVTLSGQELSARLVCCHSQTRPCSAMLLMLYLSKPLSIELFNMTRYAEGKLFVIIIRQLFSGRPYLNQVCEQPVILAIYEFTWVSCRNDLNSF